jgi:hypothetical protein
MLIIDLQPWFKTTMHLLAHLRLTIRPIHSISPSKDHLSLLCRRDETRIDICTILAVMIVHKNLTLLVGWVQLALDVGWIHGPSRNVTDSRSRSSVCVMSPHQQCFRAVEMTLSIVYCPFGGLIFGASSHIGVGCMLITPYMGPPISLTLNLNHRCRQNARTQHISNSKPQPKNSTTF